MGAIGSFTFSGGVWASVTLSVVVTVIIVATVTASGSELTKAFLPIASVAGLIAVVMGVIAGRIIYVESEGFLLIAAGVGLALGMIALMANAIVSAFIFAVMLGITDHFKRRQAYEGLQQPPEADAEADSTEAPEVSE